MHPQFVHWWSSSYSLMNPTINHYFPSMMMIIIMKMKWKWTLKKKMNNKKKTNLRNERYEKSCHDFCFGCSIFSFFLGSYSFFFATKLQTGATIIIDNELLWLANVAAADIIIIIIMILAFKQILILMMMMFDNQKTKIKSTRKKIE